MESFSLSVLGRDEGGGGVASFSLSVLNRQDGGSGGGDGSDVFLPVSAR